MEGSTKKSVFPVENEVSFSREQTGTGGSDYLYTGEFSGIYTFSILKFYRPTKPTVWNVDSVQFSLSYRGGFGETPLEINGKLFDIAWSESDPPEWDMFFSPDTLEVFEGYSVSPADSGEYYINATPYADIITGWLNWEYSGSSDSVWTDPVRNDSALTLRLIDGIWAEFGDDPSMIRFLSCSADKDSLRPKLNIFITARDSLGGEAYQDTLIVTSAADLFLLKNDSTDVGDNLMLGSGAIFQTNLQFNLDSLWLTTEGYITVINRAVITLFKIPDPDHVLPFTKSVFPFKLSDDLGFSDPLSAIESGFTSTSTAIDTALDSLEIVVTRPGAEWSKGIDFNRGIALHSGGEGLDIDRLRFYSSKTDSIAKKPKLTIFYTLLPK